MGNTGSNMISVDPFSSLDRRNKVKNLARKCLNNSKIERQPSKLSVRANTLNNFSCSESFGKYKSKSTDANKDAIIAETVPTVPEIVRVDLKCIPTVSLLNNNIVLTTKECTNDISNTCTDVRPIPEPSLHDDISSTFQKIISNEHEKCTVKCTPSVVGSEISLETRTKCLIDRQEQNNCKSEIDDRTAGAKDEQINEILNHIQGTMNNIRDEVLITKQGKESNQKEFRPYKRKSSTVTPKSFAGSYDTVSRRSLLSENMSMRSESKSTKQSVDTLHKRKQRKRVNSKLQADKENKGSIVKKDSSDINKETTPETDTKDKIPKQKKKSFRRTAFSRYRQMLEV